MKVILPENQSEITLEQYQRYVKLLERTDLDIYNFNRRKLEIFTPLTFKDTENVTQVDFEFCLNQIELLLMQIEFCLILIGFCLNQIELLLMHIEFCLIRIEFCLI